jgi:hypothetical protein
MSECDALGGEDLWLAAERGACAPAHIGKPVPFRIIRGGLVGLSLCCLSVEGLLSCPQRKGEILWSRDAGFSARRQRRLLFDSTVCDHHIE